MALIGEQFEESDEICGVVASVRQRQDKLALWTKNATNEAAQVCLILLILYLIVKPVFYEIIGNKPVFSEALVWFGSFFCL